MNELQVTTICPFSNPYLFCYTCSTAIEQQTVATAPLPPTRAEGEAAVGVEATGPGGPVQYPGVRAGATARAEATTTGREAEANSTILTTTPCSRWVRLGQARPLGPTQTLGTGREAAGTEEARTGARG